MRDEIAEDILGLPHNSIKTYYLAELIDIAESNNPQTRVFWEHAGSQGASFGVARSELYRTLAAPALCGLIHRNGPWDSPSGVGLQPSVTS